MPRSRCQYTRSAGAAMLALAAVLAGCAGSSAGGGGATRGGGRPMLNSSAAEAAMASGAPDAAAAELEFFDALSDRPLVCHDDVLHAAALLSGPRTPETYGDRLESARRLGLVDTGFDRPPHEAATVGEVAKVMLRLTDGVRTSAGLSQEQAIMRMAGRGLLPVTAKPYQGMTGAQLLTVIRGVREELGGRARGLAPAEPVIQTTGMSSGASAQEPPQVRPVAAVDRPVASVPVVEVQSDGAAAGHPASARPEVPPAPREDLPTAAKPSAWVPGKPLKKGGA